MQTSYLKQSFYPIGEGTALPTSIGYFFYANTFKRFRTKIN